MTARDAIADRVRGLDLGADDYVVKPFEWKEFLARIRAAIRRVHDQTSTTIRAADLEIDLSAKSARRGERRIDLTAREFALLEYLAHRKDRIVTRAEIIDHLYDDVDEINSNVVDVYIGFLRKKVDQDEAVKLIHTRRGLGYVLTEQP